MTSVWTGACPDLPDEAWEATLGQDEADRRNVRVDDLLRARWVRRLMRDWHNINLGRCRGQLSPPQIALHGDKRRWGSWDPQRRLLTIAERQIACYTWSSVQETLRHEVAHQYVNEVLRVVDETPHSHAFKHACRIVGADPRASADGGIPLYRNRKVHEPDDPTLRRIRKLLALADGSPSEAEANSAYRKANALLLKFNLARTELEAERGYVYRRIGEPAQRVSSVHYSVSSILSAYFFVECLWVHDYLAAMDQEGRVLEIMGTIENVEMAEHVHATLHRVAGELWERYRATSGARGAKAKREYMEGVLDGFSSTLARGRSEDRQEGLVWVGDPRLTSYVADRHPLTRTMRVSGVELSDNHAAGRADGRNVRIHRPMGAGATNGGRLLGGR